MARVVAMYLWAPQVPQVPQTSRVSRAPSVEPMANKSERFTDRGSVTLCLPVSSSRRLRLFPFSLLSFLLAVDCVQRLT